MVKENLEIEGLEGYSVKIELKPADEDDLTAEKVFIKSLISKIFADIRALGGNQKFQLHLSEHNKTHSCTTWSVIAMPDGADMRSGPTWFVDTRLWDYEAHNLKDSDEDYKGYLSIAVVMPGTPANSDGGCSLSPASDAIINLVCINYAQQISIHYRDWSTDYKNGPYGNYE